MDVVTEGMIGEDIPFFQTTQCENSAIISLGFFERGAPSLQVIGALCTDRIRPGSQAYKKIIRAQFREDFAEIFSEFRRVAFSLEKGKAQSVMWTKKNRRDETLSGNTRSCLNGVRFSG